MEYTNLYISLDARTLKEWQIDIIVESQFQYLVSFSQFHSMSDISISDHRCV